jgi:hypothetical protein
MSPIFFLLLVKHSICDLALQGRFALKYPPKSKLQFWHPNGTLHALDHAIGTAVVFLLVSVYLKIFTDVTNEIFYGFVLFAFLDFWLHLLIDWRKSHVLKKANVGIMDQKFWIISAIDQILHFTCYYFYVWCFDKLFF